MDTIVTRKSLENLYRRLGELQKSEDSKISEAASKIVSSVLASNFVEHRTESKLRDTFLNDNFDMLLERASKSKIRKGWLEEDIAEKAISLIKKEL